MPYATAQDIIDRYGDEAFILAADRDGDGVADTGVADKALTDATGEIDMYVGARYSLPLAEVPALLVKLAVDIAMYLMSADAGSGTEEKRQRYTDALAHLRAISKGTADLGLESPPPTTDAEVITSGNDRLFDRDTLKGLV